MKLQLDTWFWNTWNDIIRTRSFMELKTQFVFQLCNFFLLRRRLSASNETIYVRFIVKYVRFMYNTEHSTTGYIFYFRFFFLYLVLGIFERFCVENICPKGKIKTKNTNTHSLKFTVENTWTLKGRMVERKKNLFISTFLWVFSSKLFVVLYRNSFHAHTLKMSTKTLTNTKSFVAFGLKRVAVSPKYFWNLGRKKLFVR